MHNLGESDLDQTTRNVHLSTDEGIRLVMYIDDAAGLILISGHQSFHRPSQTNTNLRHDFLDTGTQLQKPQGP